MNKILYKEKTLMYLTSTFVLIIIVNLTVVIIILHHLHYRVIIINYNYGHDHYTTTESFCFFFVLADDFLGQVVVPLATVNSCQTCRMTMPVLPKSYRSEYAHGQLNLEVIYGGYYTVAQRYEVYLPQEDKLHIFKLTCNFLFIT